MYVWIHDSGTYQMQHTAFGNRMIFSLLIVIYVKEYIEHVSEQVSHFYFTPFTFHHTIYLIHDSRDVFLDAPIYSAYTITYLCV